MPDSAALSATPSTKLLTRWWVRTPAILRRFSTLLAAAWGDGIYLTAWPSAAVWLPSLMLAVGLGFGAGHWHLASKPVTFALIFPLVLLATFAGTLSANLGLMLVLGYAIGDLFFAGPPAAWAAYYRWPVAHFVHLTIAQLVSYLLFFMLAALPILNTRLMLGDLVRRGKFKRPNGWPAKAFTVTSMIALAAIHGAFVYTWTFTAPMIFRLSWVWAGQGASPFNITYFQNITVPWLPAAAVIAFLVRSGLEYRVGSSAALATSVPVNQRLDTKPHSSRPRALETLFAALVVTLLSSGFFWSIQAGVIFLVVITALFWLRAFVLPTQPAWQAWAEQVTKLPIVMRWAVAMGASYFVTRLVLSIDLSRFSRYGSIFKNFSASIANKAPVDFWVELMCIALSVAIALTLLPDGTMRPRAEHAPVPQPATQSRPGFSPPMMLFIGIVNFCLDPFCCFGASDFLVAIMIAALLWEMLPFLLALSEIAIPLLETGLGTLAGDAGVLGATEAVAEIETDTAIANAEATLLVERRQLLETALQENGITEPEMVESHIDAVDLNEPVVAKTLAPGDTFDIWVRDGGEPGIYGTPSGTNPDTLGIDTAGRHLETYQVTESLPVVQSTAKDFSGGIIQGVGGKGGGLQYLLPPDWQSVVEKLL